jgi:hypothetical protein
MFFAKFGVKVSDEDFVTINIKESALLPWNYIVSPNK